MQKANSMYSQKEYAVAMEVYTYKGHYAVLPEDQSSGVIRKKNGVTEQSLNQIYSIQNEVMKVMVDSSENIVGITFPDSASFSFTTDDAFFNKYNRYVSNISLTDNKNGMQSLTINYREGLPYEKISIKLTNSFAEEITFFYADKLSEEKPKLRVVLKKIAAGVKLNYSVGDIVYKSNDGYKLTEKFKNFKLIDFRYQNKM